MPVLPRDPEILGRGSSVQERSDRRVPRSEAVRVRPALPFSAALPLPTPELPALQASVFSKTQAPVPVSLKLQRTDVENCENVRLKCLRELNIFTCTSHTYTQGNKAKRELRFNSTF